MTSQHLADGRALSADATAVDETDVVETGSMGCLEVIEDDVGYVTRRKGVKIEDTVYGDRDGRFLGHYLLGSFNAIAIAP